MKAVLISIHPRHCENIASGKKTVEVRKSVPKMPTPFKCYIYCASMKSLPLEEYVALHASTGGLCDKWSRKVIGEFVCDRIDKYFNYGFALRDENGKVFDVGKFLSNACLTEYELADYVRGYGIFYGWHISDLKIYDKPRELREFIPACPSKNDEKGSCRGCKYEGRFCRRERITRPPQSWMYVEEFE